MKNWPKLSRVTYFLTHRCNLVCSYCTTILKENRTLEMTPDETLEAVDKMCDLKTEMVMITGGEPTVRKDLQAVVDRLNDREQYFVIISNATPPRILKIKGVRGLSCSVDDLASRYDKRDEMIKSSAGLQVLLKAQEMRWDVTASVVAGRANCHHIPSLISRLSDLGIVSYVCVLHDNVRSASDIDETLTWRFRSKSKEHSLLPDQAQYLSETLLSMKRQGFLVLNDTAYLKGIAKWGSSLDWHCSKPVDLVVDSDGSILTCSDFWGPECKEMNIRTLNVEAWREAWMRDQVKCTGGCYWQCIFQSESQSSAVKPGERNVPVA